MENIKVCVFDAYGTLFDVHSASKRLSTKIGENYEEFSNLWRAKQLEYSFLREIMDDYIDFYEITRDSLRYAMLTYNLDESLEKELMNLYNELSAYDEVQTILKELKERGFRTVILSNGSYDMLLKAVDTARLSNLIDNVVSVADIEKFKPRSNVYEMINYKMNVKNEEVVFFSSNGWDIAGATKYGFNTIWINRFNKVVDQLSDKPKFIVKNLKEAIQKF
ncbi:MAG: haloacid dehalogenase type II [Sarcina sp.]